MTFLKTATEENGFRDTTFVASDAKDSPTVTHKQVAELRARIADLERALARELQIPKTQVGHYLRFLCDIGFLPSDRHFLTNMYTGEWFILPIDYRKDSVS